MLRVRGGALLGAGLYWGRGSAGGGALLGAGLCWGGALLGAGLCQSTFSSIFPDNRYLPHL